MPLLDDNFLLTPKLMCPPNVKIDAALIRETAMQEYQDELFRLRVDKAKIHLREKHQRSFWKKLFPYRITIERR